MLILEVEFLLGRVFAARNQEEPFVDWPPQPDRIFSALVAAWAARGKVRAEQDALEWLERQPAPSIVAAELLAPFRAPVSYVPPNDFKTSAGGFDVIPARRRRQERRFPNSHLPNPIMYVVWDVDCEAGIVERLDTVARDTAYIGHSASLTRCRFTVEPHHEFDSEPALRSVYEGRLAELESAFQRDERPKPGFDLIPIASKESPNQNVFSDDLLVLADAGGRVPDIRAMPIVARVLRDALMAKLGRKGLPIGEWLSGHDSTGNPSRLPHLAIIPLADVGWGYSEGRVMGCALVRPKDVDRAAVDNAVAELLEERADGQMGIELHVGALGTWNLSPEERPSQSSLKPSRWLGLFQGGRFAPAHRWATVTPIALDRFPKASDDTARLAQTLATIKDSCRNVGLPEPRHVSLSDGSSVEGAPSAYPAPGAPPWQRWQVPSSLRGRRLQHATLEFEDAVRGPVLLGAGRYVGLGLCLPVNSAQ